MNNASMSHTALRRLSLKFEEFVQVARENLKRKRETKEADEETPAKRQKPDTTIEQAVTTLETAMKKYSSESVKDQLRGLHEIKFKDIKVLHQIGEGSFGVVHKARLWRQDVAVKTIRSENPDDNKLFQDEVDLLSELRHPNIVEFMGTCRDPDGRLALISEFCANGALEDVLQKRHKRKMYLPVVTVLQLALGVAKGLCWLHHKNIMHRDLKPDNILLTSDFTAKISDLGLAHRKQGGVTLARYSKVGTAEYRAPEVTREEKYGFASDVFSFGLVVCELVNGYYALKEDPKSTLAQQLRDGERPPIDSRCPASLAALIRECWDGDQRERLTMDQVVDNLEEMVHERQSNPSLAELDMTQSIKELGTRYVLAHDKGVKAGGGMKLPVVSDTYDSSGGGGGETKGGKEAKSADDASAQAASVLGALLGAEFHSERAMHAADSPVLSAYDAGKAS